ncbi:hypothetical protein FRC05_003565, partial [Tulasnella sp. 425]
FGLFSLESLDITACAKECIAKADPSYCKPDDVACLCVNNNYINQVSECVQYSCSPDDAKKAAECGIKECKAVGIDPENPIPKCGIYCVENTPTSCDPTDAGCVCTDQGYLEQVVWCFKSSCYGDDLKNAKCAGEAYCRAAGYDISSIFGY